MEKRDMRRTIRNFMNSCQSNLPSLAAFAVALLLTALCSARSFAQEKGQKTYPSAEAASAALFAALQADNEKAILDVLGQDAKPIVSTGNMSEDSDRHASIVRRYMELHRLVNEPDGTTTIYIGAENWPMPIPLVQKSGKWFFDTDAAKQEILFRRIGHNELTAIRVCQELVAAQKEYAAEHGNAYAAKIASDPDQQNGLYWPVTGEKHESPIGPLIAEASVGDGAGSASSGSGAPIPFHGYFFRVLTRQGKNASGGAADYVVNDRMTAGFAFIAYPADYRDTGVMTFVVNQDGVVLQKDLGEKTSELAKAIQEYNPDSTWQKAEEQMEQSASDQKAK
jgi:Protein of unknown function (DUF2950)